MIYKLIPTFNAKTWDTYKEKQKQNTSNGHKILRITEREKMNGITNKNLEVKLKLKLVGEKKSEITEMVWMCKKNVFMTKY